MPFFLARKLAVPVQEFGSSGFVAAQDFMGRWSGTGKVEADMWEREERHLGKSLCPLTCYAGWMWSLLFSVALTPQPLAI